MRPASCLLNETRPVFSFEKTGRTFAINTFRI